MGSNNLANQKIALSNLLTPSINYGASLILQFWGLSLPDIGHEDGQDWHGLV